MYRSLRWLIGVLAMLVGASALAASVSVLADDPSAIGRSTAFFQETGGRLTLAEAAAARHDGKFLPGISPVLNFGIGAKPVWIYFAVNNPGNAPVPRRLSIETAWLDRVDVYVQRHNQTVAKAHLGDRLPYSQRPLVSRYFVVPQVFDPGRSEVYLRVETPDPMVVPIYLLSQDASRLRQTRQELSYGIVYGFLLALMAYNAILYFSLRSSRYLRYSIYLATFIAMNVAYTGHGFAWLWPESLNWQQWSNPILMLAFGISGLLFAIRFLELRSCCLRVHRFVLGFCITGGALLGLAILLGSQIAALLVAFSFALLFSGLMLALGVFAVRAGQKPARYFLLAALAAMVGAVLTALSTWGFIPHNSWTFRAVEIGMLFDATLLALALACQMRAGQEQRLLAERLAQLDPLTGLDNRRAFYDKTSPLWAHAQRHGLATSVMLLDIDRFKQINDAHGHAFGDEVLKAVANALRQRVRQEDVLARWGGEEFIVFMPDTPVEAGSALAERLRAAIADLRILHARDSIAVTASFGVAQKGEQHETLDALIASADASLFQSKQQGRNQVTASLA